MRFLFSFFLYFLSILVASDEQRVTIASDGSQQQQQLQQLQQQQQSELDKNNTNTITSWIIHWQNQPIDINNIPDLPFWCKKENNIPQLKIWNNNNNNNNNNNSQFFPLVLIPSSSIFQSWSMNDLKQHLERDYSILYLYLIKYGAILFRQFNINNSVVHFDTFVKQFKQWTPLPYIGGAAVRNQVYGDVFTTNESPPDARIPFHHEMAQTPNHPLYLFFYCHTPPLEGGETPILLSHELYYRAKLRFPQFIDKLESKGVRYVRYLPEWDDHSSPIGRSWRSTFLTNDSKEAERRQIESGGEFEWQDGNIMKTISAVLPAIRWDNRIAKYTFFNSIVAAYTGWNDARNIGEKAVIYGDGTEIDKQDIEGIIEIMNELTVAIPWQKDDIILIDNKQVMHSRKSFKPPRAIYAALCK